MKDQTQRETNGAILAALVGETLLPGGGMLLGLAAAACRGEAATALCKTGLICALWAPTATRNPVFILALTGAICPRLPQVRWTNPLLWLAALTAAITTSNWQLGTGGTTSLTAVATTLATITLLNLPHPKETAKAALGILAALTLTAFALQTLGAPNTLPHKNQIAIAATLTLAAALAFKKWPLATATTAALLINPSTMGRASTAILWTTFLLGNHPRLRKPAAIGVASAVIALAIAIAAWGTQTNPAALLLKTDLNGRTQLWAYSWETAKRNPMTGAGTPFWETTGGNAFVNANAFFAPHAHNGVFHTLSSSGVPTAALFLGWLGVCILHSEHSRKTKTLLAAGAILPLTTEAWGITLSGAGLLGLWLCFLTNPPGENQETP